MDFCRHNRRSVLIGGTTLAALALAESARAVAQAEMSTLNPQPLPPSPDWARALPNGPDMRSKMTEEYAKLIARDAYFWAWPLINIYGTACLRSRTFPSRHVLEGRLPIAPLNHLAMLTDYIEPEERACRCPNQDVVYGAGSVRARSFAGR